MGTPMPRSRPAAQALLLAIVALVTLPRPAASAPETPAPPEPLAVSGIAGATYLTADAAAMRRFYGQGAGFPEAPAKPGMVRFAIGSRQWIEFQSVRDAVWPRRLQYVTLEAPSVGDVERSLWSRGIAADWIGSDPRTRALQFEDPAGNRLRVAAPWAAPDAPSGNAAPFSTHLQHFGFPVPRALAASTLSFYGDTLGWPEAARMLDPGGRPAMVKFRIPGGRGEVAELVVVDKGLNKWAAGAIDHVKFDVGDINAAWRSLHRGGIADQARQLPAVDADHLWAINLFDPELTRIEIQELAPTTAPVGTVSSVGGER